MNERKGILAVDDTLAALKLLTDTLIMEGYPVRPANSGEQALAAVAAELPELILLDVRMPDMDGFEVCRRIKALQASHDIPILFLSATTDMDERIKGFEAGAVDFITKPFQRAELLARVRTHLELSRLQTRLEAMVERRTDELKASNEQLQHELAERKKAEDALNLEKKITDALLESVPGLLYMYDEDGYLVKWNKKHLEITGFSTQELTRTHFLEWFEGIDRQKVSESISKMFQNGYADVEVNFKIKNGAKIPFIFTAVPLEMENKKYFVGIGIDITQQKKAEEQIKLSLTEKEILIRELYHRTKNNMQVICSMLKLHSYYKNDEKTLQIFRDMENRIYTMALVHQKLYQSKNLSSIYFHDYIHELCDLLMNSHNVSRDKIIFKLDIAEVSVLIDIAVPCGLLLNELISNSIKYAFPDEKKGEIYIKLCRTEDGSIDMFYGDNGIGVPLDFDFKKNGKMGIQTIYAIGCHQLQGKVDFESGNGIKCHVCFQDKYYSQRI